MSKSDLKVNDEYYTPDHVWDDIVKFIPTGKVIWEPFNNALNKNSMRSALHMRELGFEVVAKKYNPNTEKNDFFSCNYGDVVVSNPPFSLKREVLTRLKELGKPFILILPHATMNTKYFRELFMQDKEFGIIIPKKRIDFDNKRLEASNCFDCSYYCWKVGVRGLKWIS